MEGKLYHVSNVGGLTVLEPKISTHKQAWVYATKNLEMALLFGSNKSMGDLDGAYGVLKDGKTPYFYEAYEGAFKRRFEGCVCYIYELDTTTFEDGKTSFKAEVVSSSPVKVLSCNKVDNLYAYLINLTNENKLCLRTYSLNEEYQKMIKSHIKHRIKLFEIYKDKSSVQYEFCQQKFPHWLKEVEKENENIK